MDGNDLMNNKAVHNYIKNEWECEVTNKFALWHSIPASFTRAVLKEVSSWPLNKIVSYYASSGWLTGGLHLNTVTENIIKKSYSWDDMPPNEKRNLAKSILNEASLSESERHHPIIQGINQYIKNTVSMPDLISASSQRSANAKEIRYALDKIIADQKMYCKKTNQRGGIWRYQIERNKNSLNLWIRFHSLWPGFQYWCDIIDKDVVSMKAISYEALIGIGLTPSCWDMMTPESVNQDMAVLIKMVERMSLLSG